MRTHYIDTNVIMDFLLSRDSSAYRVLMDGFLCKYSFIVSELVSKELAFQGLSTEGESFFTLAHASGKLRVEPIVASDTGQAKKWRDAGRTHYNDALHAAVARRACDGNVLTKNLKDFRLPGVVAHHPDNI